MEYPSGIQLFVSNRYEHLYAKMQEQLFGQPYSPTEEESPPFSPCAAAFMQRLIVTPSAALHQWVTSRLASDPNQTICMGLQRLAKELLCAKLSQWFQPISNAEPLRRFPHHLELIFAIEKKLIHLLESTADNSLSSFFVSAPIHSYKGKKVLRALSESVSRLFLDYGRYGGDLFEMWESSKHPHAEWQKVLWNQLFGKSGLWHVPYQLPILLDLSNCIAPQNMQLHLFCYTDLSLLEQTLLQALSLHRPVFIYSLSPTRMYAEDLLSPRTQLFLRGLWEKRGVHLQELKQLTDLLQEPNPLLARLGTAMRLRDSQLNQAALERHEDYFIPYSLFNIPLYADRCDHTIHKEDQADSITLLQAIQADLLLLRRPDLSEKLPIEANDRSIQIHAAPTCMREVEALYHALLGLLNGKVLQKGDIALYVVDLPRYLPFLQARFDSEDSPFKLEYFELPLLLQSSYIQAFHALLQLVNGRFSTCELLNLLESPHIHTKAGLSAQDLKTLRRYIKQAPIYWGENVEAQEAFLERSACSLPLIEKNGVGTWQQGICQLFTDLVVGLKEGEPATFSFSEAPMIEKWLVWLRALQLDSALLKAETAYSLKEWAELLRLIATSYLDPLTQKQDEEVLFERLQMLGQAGSSFPEERFSFSSIAPRLEWLLNQPKRLHREIQGCFASLATLQPYSLTPARIIGLIGLEEDAFPRKKREAPLDLLRDNPAAEKRLKPSDQERALILQALLSAKEALIITYLTSSGEKAQNVSRPVLELIEELNQGYTIQGKPAGEKITYLHPAHAYDPSYFCKDSVLFNPTEKDYQLASLQMARLAPPILTQVSPKALQEAASLNSWQLRQLQLAAKDPAALYLRQQLGITLLDSQRHLVHEDEPFTTTWSERYRIQDAALQEPVELLLERAKKRGELPFGLFGTLAANELSSDVFERRKRLKQYAIQTKLWNLSLNPGCVHPFHHEELGLQLPVLTLKANGQEELLLTGKLSFLSKEGLLIQGTATLEEKAASFPLYLTFLLVRPQLEQVLECQIAPACLFWGKEQRFHIPFSSVESTQEAFLNFIKYAEKTRQEPSPVHQDWLKPLLQGDIKRAAQTMETALETPQNSWRYRHILFARKQYAHADLESWLQDWIEPLQNAFAPLMTGEK